MLSSEPCSSSRPRETLSAALSCFLLFFIKKKKKTEGGKKKKKKPRSKPFMSIFKTQPHQQYAFQLFPPSTQPVTAQPIINGSYRQRKGLHIIGSCCLISRRRLRTRLSSFSYRQHQSPASTCCLLLRYSWLCSSRGCFLAFLVTRDKSACQSPPGRARVGWMEVGGKGSTHGCPGRWLYPCIGRMLYDGVMHVPGDSLAAQSSPRCPCCH